MEEKKDMVTDPTASSIPIDEIEERVEGGGEVNENEPTLPEPTAIITSSPHYVKTENKPITISVMLNNTPQNNGTATIQLDNTTLTTTTINNGIATYTPDLTNTTTGTHTLTITINPTTTYTTKTLTQTITIYNTTSEAPENYTDNYGNDIPVTINVEEGQAQLHLTKTLAVGTYTLNGQFQGTATYQTAQDTGTITITKIPTTTTLTSDTTTITQGNSINLTATINNTNATGTITLYDNNTPVLFNQTLTNGTVTMNYTPTTAGTHNLTATYSGDNTYNTSTSTEITVTATVGNDPFFGIYDIQNWGSYPHSTVSGTAQTGTTTPATTSDLTIDATNRTITNKDKKFYVYNQTLQDFFDYYGDEFSLIVYKSGGDGRYDIGFMNTTNGGYKLGYTCYNGGCTIRNEETNTAIGSSEVLYQKYNEFTFAKDSQDNITLYYCTQGTTYMTQQLGTVNDMTEYFLYFKSYNQPQLVLTTDTTLIDYPSRQKITTYIDDNPDKEPSTGITTTVLPVSSGKYYKLGVYTGSGSNTEYITEGTVDLYLDDIYVSTCTIYCDLFDGWIPKETINALSDGEHIVKAVYSGTNIYAPVEAQISTIRIGTTWGGNSSLTSEEWEEVVSIVESGDITEEQWITLETILTSKVLTDEQYDELIQITNSLSGEDCIKLDPLLSSQYEKIFE